VSGWLRELILRSRPVDTDSDLAQEPTFIKQRPWLNLLAQVLIVAFPLIATGGVVAQETPHLVALNLSKIDGWCGDHAVYFQRHAVDPSTTLTWLDIHSRAQKKIQLGSSWTRVSACSPDGRWVITQTGAEWRFSHGEDADECRSQQPLELPTVTLWDTLEDKHYSVGQGIIDFRWSTDGKNVLFNFYPECGLDRDLRNTFQLPAAIGEFRAVSALAAIRQILKPSDGWPDKVQIERMNWLDDNRFVVQLPAGSREPEPLGFGAIVAVRLNNGAATDVQQLNPRGFQSSWVLGIAQAKSQESTDMLASADCRVDTYSQGSYIVCSNRSLGQAEEKPIQLNLAHYCQTLAGGDVEEFCKPAEKIWSWFVIRRGDEVLLQRRSIFAVDGGGTLFRIEHDNGGYLK
jgi:hypothetical protein